MDTPSKGLIDWFARNPVAANLVMFLVFFAGVLSMWSISKEMIPRSDLNVIRISVPYPGAAPIEVEKGVILPIESALEGLQGIKSITARANRDSARLTLDIEPNANINEVTTLVENRVDAITNFPEDIENPRVQRLDTNMWAMGVSVYGNMTDSQKKSLGDEIFNELLAMPEVKELRLWGAGDYEISIEVKEDQLRALNLTLSEIASAVRQSSLDLPAGVIRTASGNILVRTEGKAYTGPDFASIVVRSNTDGTQLRLADVAEVRDGFKETSYANRFDRANAFTVGIFSLEGQNLLDISQAVNAYAKEKQQTLPIGHKIAVFNDEAYYLNGRLTMMAENLLMGGILVALVLSLFLNIQIALWVMVGIPLSFAGALWLMPLGGVTINVMSLFAFIMVLGIVVDDAIIIGESVFSEVSADYQKELGAGYPPSAPYIASTASVITGTQRVATPSTIGLLTTMAAFLPMIFIGGSFDGIAKSMGIVVILSLFFSLIESKLILPAHLVGFQINRPPSNSLSALQALQNKVSGALDDFIDHIYQPLLKSAVQHRYITLAGFLSLLIIVIGATTSGLVRHEFFPVVPGDDVKAQIVMQDGASQERMIETIAVIENAIYAIDQRYRDKYPESVGLVEHVAFFVRNDIDVIFRTVLTKAEVRNIDATEIERLWREEVGILPNVRKQRYVASEGPSGPRISLSLSGPNPNELSRAGMELQQYLTQFQGVYDIYNSQGAGSKELLITLKPFASQIGVSLMDVAKQVRHAFYGEEAQRIQRNSDTVKVMVRYPIEQRRSISTLEDMHIRTVGGDVVAIGDVADIQLGVGVTAIDRLDRKRTLTVTAEVDADTIESSDVVRDVRETFIPVLLQKYPGVEFRLSGGTQEQDDYYLKMLVSGAASLFLIYSLLAVPLRSYVQPIIIMSVIPFGFIGAVAGHVLFDVTINILSLFGIIALAGVVVNDSLIMVEFANRERGTGMACEDAIYSATRKRFRAILLTTLTTFVGLLPMLFETSVQAQFVIPMALSLSFGIVFASAITLILVPCLYVMAETNRRFFGLILSVPLAFSLTHFLHMIGAITPLLLNALLTAIALALASIVVAKLTGRLPEVGS